VCKFHNNPPPPPAHSKKNYSTNILTVLYWTVHNTFAEYNLGPNYISLSANPYVWLGSNFHITSRRGPCGWAGIAQSVYRLATGWTVLGSNPVDGEIFRTRPDRPWDPSSFLYNGYRAFHGLKRPRRGVDQSPPSSAEVKDTVPLYLYSPYGPSWYVLGWT